MKLFYLYTRNNLIIEVFKSLRAAEIWIEENLNPIMKGGYSIKEGSLFEREEPGKGVYSMSVRIKPQVEESCS